MVTVYHSALFAEEVDTVNSGQGNALGISTFSDSVVVDSITVGVDSASPPVTIALRPVGFHDTAESCTLWSTYIWADTLLRVSPSSSAFLLDPWLNACLACSTVTHVPPIRNGQPLAARVHFFFHRYYPDTTLSGVDTVLIQGSVGGTSIGASVWSRSWLMEFGWDNGPVETVDFGALEDTCEDFLDIRSDTAHDMEFAGDTIAAPFGIKPLGMGGLADELLYCDRMDSIRGLLDTVGYAFAQASYATRVAFEPGGMYWIRTREGDRVLLVNTANSIPGGSYRRHQFLWAYYE